MYKKYNIIITFLLSILILGCSKDDGKKNQPSLKFKSFLYMQLEAASAYSQSKGGSAVLVLQNGKIIYEKYQNGSDRNTATAIRSGTKGFFGALTAIAIQEGIINGYDENISQTITEWQNSTLHPGKDKITLRHLISLTSGLSQNIKDIGGDNPPEPDLYNYAINNLNLNKQPGTYFQYGPSHYYVYGAYLTRKLKQAGINQNPLEYLETKIFDRIGLSYSSWIYDQSGNPHIPNGCFITPRNWVKYGQLLLQNGKWNNEQIIKKQYVKELFEPKGINPGYGVSLWLNKQGGYPPLFSTPAPSGSVGGFIFYDGYTDIIGCLGAGKNRLYIIPSLNSVIVRQTLEESDNYLDNDFLKLILPE